MCFYHFIHFFLHSALLKCLKSHGCIFVKKILQVLNFSRPCFPRILHLWPHKVHSVFTLVTYMTSDTSRDISVNRFLQF